MAVNPFDEFDAAAPKVQLQRPDAPTNAFDEFTPAPPPVAPDTSSNFMRGLKRTLPELKELTGGTLAAVGDVTGIDSLKKYGLDVYKRASDSVVPLEKPNDSASTAWEKVKQGDLGAGVDFVENAAGYTSGQALESLAAATAGGIVGSEVPGAGNVAGAVGGVVAKGVVKEAIKHQAEKLIAEQVAKGAAKDVAEKAGADYVAAQAGKTVTEQLGQKTVQRIGGAALGSQGLNTIMEVGSVYPDALQKAQDEGRSLQPLEKARALGGAFAAAGIESAADLFNLGVLFRGVKNVGEAAAKTGVKQAVKAYAGRAAVAAGEGALREGGTEAAQTFLERLGANQSLNDADAWRDYVDSSVTGAVGGVLFGGVAGLHERHAERAKKDQEQQKRKQLPLGEDPTDGLRANVADAMAAVKAATSPDEFLAAAQNLDIAHRDLYDHLERSGRILPPPGAITVDSAGNATGATQADNAARSLDLKRQGEDQSLVQGRTATGLTPDVNAARINHPAAAPNGTLPDGSPMPNPNDGPLSRVAAAAAIAGTLPNVQAIAARADAAQAAPEPTRHEEMGGGKFRQVDTATEELLPPDEGAIQAHMTDLFKAGPGRAPNVKQMVTAWGLTPARAWEIRNAALADATGVPRGPVKQRGTISAADVVARAQADLAALEATAARNDGELKGIDRINRNLLARNMKNPAALAEHYDMSLAPSDGGNNGSQVPGGRGEQDAAVQALAERQGSVQQPQEPVLPQLRGPGDNAAPAVGGELPGVQGGGGAAPESGAHAGSREQQLGVSAGEPPVGDQARASEQPAQERAADAQRADALAGGVGPNRGAGSVDAALQDQSGRNVGGGSTDNAVAGGAEGGVTGTPEALHAAAHEAATSPKNDLPPPTEAQKEQGNYKKGHYRLHGLDISIENPAGSRRRPEWPPLKHHYGYFRGTVGVDKDHVDVFLMPHAGDASRPVFVIDQNKPNGRHDEHKVVMGAADEAEARAAYLANYEKGWTGLGGIRQMTLPEFKAWVKDPNQTTKRASDERSAADRPVVAPGTGEGERAAAGAVPASGRVDGSEPAAAPAPAAAATAFTTVKTTDGATHRVRVEGLAGVGKKVQTYTPEGKMRHKIMRADIVKEGVPAATPEAASNPTPKPLPNATAPEHVTTGVDDRELGQIVKEFNTAHAASQEPGEEITHVFDPPAKKDIVRINDKVKEYVARLGWMTPEEAQAQIEKWKEHARAQGADPKARHINGQKIVLSLFDYSGAWSDPWVEAGYQVHRFDIQNDLQPDDPGYDPDLVVGDVNKFSVGFFNDMFGSFDGLDVHAILAACPCTDFAVSGARHFAAKDKDGRTVSSVKLVHQTLATIEYFKPAIWSLENPVGRIENLGGLPPWRASFDPNAFGEDYTKKTLLWGRFNGDMPIAPTEATQGSKMHMKYGGKSMATKNARSVTPEGFAYAYFMANNAIDNPLLAVAGKYDRLDRDAIAAALDAGITPEEIDGLVEEHYYQELNDKAANKALRDAVAEKKETPPAKPATEATAPAPPAAAPTSEPTGAKVTTNKGKPWYIENALGTLEAYFQPGRIVDGYGGRDKVIEFKKVGGPLGGWGVLVQAVDKDGNPQKEPPRWHSTTPNQKELVKVLGPPKLPEKKAAAPAQQDKGPHYAAGAAAFAEGKDRALPAYFTQPNGANAKAWKRGWDDAEVAAARARAPTSTVDLLTKPTTAPAAGEFDEKAYTAAVEAYNALVRELAAAKDAGNKAEEARVRALIPAAQAKYKAFEAQAAKRAMEAGSLARARAERDKLDALPIGTKMRPSEFPEARGIYWEKEGPGTWTAHGEWHLKGTTRAAAALAKQGGLVKIEPPLSPSGVRTIGKNRNGHDITEDERGVRTVNGITEAVHLVPTRGPDGKLVYGVNTVHQGDYLTQAELDLAFKPEPEKAPEPLPVNAPPAKGSTNTIFTADAAAAARERIRKKLSNLNSGLDPELIHDGILLAGFHIEAGARSFAAYARAMVEDMGGIVRPYLKGWYAAVKLDPRASTLTGLDTLAAVEAANENEAYTQDAPTKEGTDDSAAQGSPPPLDTPVPDRPGSGQPVGPTRGAQSGRRKPRRADDRGIRDQGGLFEGLPHDEGNVGDGSGEPAVRDGSNDGVGASGGRVLAPDYRAPAGSLTREGSWADTAARNVDIIELARKIHGENRPATIEEQAELAKYTGFGASEIRNNLFPVANQYARLNDPERLIWPSLIQNARYKKLAERLDALPREWQQSVLQSTQYAHYTSEGVVRSIWSAVQRLGFPGGKILEPGAGIGNFAMLMPDALRKKGTYTGIEFDAPTALIGQLLSPQQHMLHDDFIKRRLPGDYFDLAIGNPPFSQTKIFGDPDYEKKGFSLHDFFFAKAIDRVRPGGLLAFVTSRYTMDKQSDKGRAYLADRADLLGAIRLPQTAFQANAGTSVVTDVIFLRKRAPGEAPGGMAWSKVATTQTKDGTAVINEYFAKNPSMVLGQERLTGNRDDNGRYISGERNAGQYTVISYDASPAELESKFAGAVEKLPQNAYSTARSAPEDIKAAVVKVDFDPAIRREGAVYLAKDGTLMRVHNGVGNNLDATVKLTPKDQAWFKGYVGLRDLANALRHAQVTNGDWKAALVAMNKGYDAFRTEHGPINDYRLQVRKTTDEDGNEVETSTRIYKNRRLYREDYDASIVTQLETINEAGEIVKSKFLLERTIGAPVVREVKTVGDALAVSLDELGTLSIPNIAARLNLSEKEAVEALGNQIYRTPQGNWQLADEYLSGDVVKKLAEAELAARDHPELQRNVDALKEAQPQKLGPSQITPKLGDSWIPGEYVSEFAKDIGAGAVTFDPVTETWTVAGSTERSRRNASAEYGTAARSPSELLDAALNSKIVRVTRTIDNRTETDPEATTAANETLQRIKDRFKSWVWTDSERATTLVDRYNKARNNIAPRRFDGSHLTLPGLSLRFSPHPHQLRAVWRQIQDGSTYLAHAVGAGKTFEMIAGGMEQKRLGLIRKPIYVVPNHMLEQFANEFMEFYPLANVMVAADENFSPERRRAFVAAATLNAPDAIVITHSAFERIGVKEESVAPIRDRIIAELEAELEDSGGDRVKRAKLQQQIEAVTQRFDRIINAGGKDSTLKFEDIGADFIYADEAHAFRKLDFATNQQVKGIDPNGSRRAMDMYVKTQYLAHNKPGRSHVFASGTAVTNTMGELYTIMRFFAQDELDRSGIATFDSWARAFGEARSELEANAAGRYETVTRFSKFDNVPELMSRVRMFMDVLTNESLGSLVKRPDIRGGKPNTVLVEPAASFQEYMRTVLAPRLEASRRWKPSKGEPNNPDPVLNIITDGRFAAMDPRFFGGSVAKGETTKIDEMASRIGAEYKATAGNAYLDTTGKPSPVKGGTQIVFFNMGFGAQSQKSRGFDSRSVLMDALKRNGVDRAHVAWFEDANTDAKKEAVFKAMRAGQIRVLIGSAKKMGTGVNVQNRLTFLHYMDPPWYPADVEQPHGRILRQGNQNDEVGINWYAIRGGYDSTMWGMVARKQRFIDQAFTGDKSMRSMEDMSEASLYEQAAAMASGDPRAIQLAGYKQDIERLERLQSAHANEQVHVRSGIRENEWKLESTEKQIARLTAAQEAIGDSYVTLKDAVVGGKTYGKPGEFGAAIKAEFNKAMATLADQIAKKPIQIGTLNGVPLVAEPVRWLDKWTDKVELVVKPGPLVAEVLTADGPLGVETDEVGLVRRAVNRLNQVERDLSYAKTALTEYQTERKRLAKKAGAPFEHTQELAEKVGLLHSLEDELRAEGVAENARLAAAREATTATAPTTGAIDANGNAGGVPVGYSMPPLEQKAGPGLSASNAHFAVDPIIARVQNGPPVQIHDSPESLPASAKESDGYKTAEGYYDPETGVVHLVAPNIRGGYDPVLKRTVGAMERARMVYAHETVGHFGIEAITGPEQWAAIENTIEKMRASGKHEALFADVDQRYKGANRAIATREAIAVMAERGVKNSIMDRIIAAARNFLRKLGFNISTGESEIRQRIVAASRYVRGGARPRVSLAERARQDFEHDQRLTQREGMFSNPPAATIDSVDAILARPDASTWQRVKDWVAGKVQDFKPAALATLTLNHVTELLSAHLPQADRYHRLVLALSADRSDLQQHGGALTDTWQKFARKNPEQNKLLMKLMHDTTIAGVDPSVPYASLRYQKADGTYEAYNKRGINQRVKELRAERKKATGMAKEALLEKINALIAMGAAEKAREDAYPALAERWAKLTPEAQKLYTTVRDYYSNHSDMVEKALIERIEALNVPADHKSALVQTIRAQFESARLQGVYFPLQRFGDYWMSFDVPSTVDGGEPEEQFRMFEDAKAFNRAVKNAKDAGFKINALGKKDSNYHAKDAPPGTFVAEVIDGLKNAGVSEQIQDQVYQSYLKSLPDLSMRKHSIHRRNVAGYSEDAMRVFANNAFHGAHQLARLRFSYQMQDSLDVLKASLDDKRRDMKPQDATSADALMGELQRRHDWIMNPTDSRFANLATSAAFSAILGLTPAAAMVNLTQPMLTTIPWLGGRHGFGKAAREVLSAQKDALRSWGNIDKHLRSDEERQAYALILKAGGITKTLAHNLAAIGEGDQLRANPTYAKVMEGVTYLFQKAEVINREATSMAAYRLARAEGKTLQEAVDYAIEANNATQFDMSNQNRPRILQSSTGKILGLFKTYAINMSWLIGRNAYQSFKGATPAERAIARKTSAGILGMSALFSGALGLPFMGIASTVMNAIMSAFGSPDEPWDFDTEFQAFLSEVLGEDAAKWIAQGPINQITGTDIGSRVSESNMWMRDGNKELEGQDAYYNMLDAIAGPMGGLVKNLYVGKQEIDEGHTWRGVETLLPKVFKDAMKAIRYETEGANTLRGDPLVDDVSGADAFRQLIGFTPGDLADQYRINNALKLYDSHVQKRRGSLLDAFALAQHIGDGDMRDATLDQIATFNSKFPSLAITGKTLQHSLRARQAAEKEIESGVRLNPKLRLQEQDVLGISE